ncbi:MAG TPA: hypothetical protein VFQ05_16805 [Candidatus Eisenbacteria bacterium]|nr:hypothetical protein [Candidatus Eisenbacteria bacterium]
MPHGVAATSEEEVIAFRIPGYLRSFTEGRGRIEMDGSFTSGG